MKKTYIIPTSDVIILAAKNVILELSWSEKEVNEGNAGLVNEDKTLGSDVNVWDSEW